MELVSPSIYAPNMIYHREQTRTPGTPCPTLCEQFAGSLPSESDLLITLSNARQLYSSMRVGSEAKRDKPMTEQLNMRG